LDHRPWGLFTLVPLGRGRPHRLFGEPVHPLTDVLLVLGELEREWRALIAVGRRQFLLGGGCFHRDSFQGSSTLRLISTRE
jgi:hypothetical protein